MDISESLKQEHSTGRESEEIISIKNASVSLGDNEVLKNVSLSIRKGEFVVIIGKSGCGKTTLLKTINGLNKPSSGEITVYGENLKTADIVSLRRRIGYAVQGAKLFPHMTVAENIRYVAKLCEDKSKRPSEAEIKKRTAELLRLLELPEELLNRFPAQLSGGQQQRAGIARAIFTNPEILLMDEPFGAVDEITRRTLQKEIKRLHETLGLTVIFITHDIREARKLATRIIVMNEGRIVQDGSFKELLKDPKDDFVRELLSDIEE